MSAHLFRARIQKNLFLDAEDILKELGLTVQDAVRMLCHEVVARKRLPWTPGAVEAVQLIIPREDPGDAETVQLTIDADLIRQALSKKRQG